MDIKVKRLHPAAILPQYAHDDDAGMDFFALERITVPPHERKLIPTGIALAIPKGYVGLIWDKSGISTNHGITTMAGVIDSGYRGEIKIVVHNLSTEPYVFEKGAKVAQMLIQPVERRPLVEVDDLDDTDRGDNGFGSTGT
jgi:dUTP pyrophosphatase